MKARIIIVNYRTPDMTRECLASLKPQVDASNDVVVVDNSCDDTTEQMRAYVGDFPFATFIAATENGGFAYGNNLGIRPALASDDPPDYFILLNPDTIAQDGCIRTLIDFMDQTPSAGIAGPRIESGSGVPQHSAFRFPSVLGELTRGMSLGLLSKVLEDWVETPDISDVRTRTDWVSGAAMIVRRQVVESIGLMDERYFLYFEEVDFCVRSFRAGWSCWYVPDAVVVHRAGAATGVSVDDESDQKRSRLPAYWYESRRRYFEQNHGGVYAALADAAYGGGFGVWRLRTKLLGKPDNKPPNVLEDLALTALRRIRTSRK